VSDETKKNADESPTEGEATAVVEDQSPSSESASDESASDGSAGDEVAVAEEVLAESQAVEAEETEAEEEEAVAEEEATEEEATDEEEADEEEAADEGEEVEEEAVAEEEEDEEDEDDENKKDWYILKVQSNREKSIVAALQRKIAVEGLEEYFGDVVVPVEKVTEFKSGKKKVVNRKLYPGYIVVNMCINDDTWFAIRETSGIGDFTGSGGKPTPMLPHEVARIIQKDEEETEEAPKLNISFAKGDQVKVKDGNFESFEGEVSEIDEHSGRITVMINIFGRSTPVELEYWQVEAV